MNATPYLHLLWKEYRAIRAFWLSMVILVLGAQWLTLSLSSDAAFSLKLVYSLALGAPAFFALGAAGTSFALEQEEGTYDFLRAAPVSARQVLTSKLGLTILATLAMLLVLVPIAWRISGRQLPEAEQLHGMLGLWLLAALEAIAWGAFFSLLTARPLTAICLALVAMSTTVHVLAANASINLTKAYDTAYLAAAPRRAVLVGLLSIADVLLGLRWLNDTEPATRSSWKSWHLPRFRRQPAITTGTSDTSATQMLAEAPDRSAMRARLSWQHWRQSGRLMLLMGGLQIVLTLMTMHGGFVNQHAVAIIPLAAMAAAAGACVFLADQENRNYRFFVEHNIPPRTVWLSRQVPWIATLAFSTLIVCLFWLDIPRLVPRLYSAISWRPYFSQTYVLPPIALGLAFVTISYAAGQWTSMFVRSGLLAGFFGLLLAGVLCSWVYMMGKFNIPWGSSVLPIPLVLLGATWLRAPDWIAENMRWSARLRAAAVVLVPAAAIFVSAINHRVNQQQDVPLDFNLAHYEAGMTEASRETAAMYRRADELLVLGPRSLGTIVTDNPEPLALLLDASRRESCTLDDPRKSSDDVELNHAHSLVELMLASSRPLEREGKLDAALNRYFDTLRMIGHWRQHRASRIRTVDGMSYVQMVLLRIVTWSMQPGQSPERIKGAIERLNAVGDSMLYLDDGLKSNYILVLRALHGDQTELAALIGEQPDLTQYLLRFRLPWERTLEERLLRLSTNSALQRVQTMREDLSRGDEIVARLPPSHSHFDAPSGLPRDYSLSNYGWGTEAVVEMAEFELRRRATLLQLSLIGYRLEHGKLPATLSELTDKYLPVVPLDPYSGRDFLYFPEGVPKALTEVDAADLAEAQRRSSEMIPGQPGIWSTGRNLVTQTLRSDGIQTTDGEAAVPSPEVNYYVERDAYDRLPLYRALGMGRFFRLPFLEAEMQQSLEREFQQRLPK
jgi:ABC-type transport system involved in multi-copper enzyme maturation permease subunit